MKLSRDKSSLAFTLIELLIVVSVLGLLAVAVLSVINPIEQINRAKDTGWKSDAEQLISATDRFYAVKGYYPWQISGESDNVSIDPMVSITSTTQEFGSDTQPMLTNISSGGTAEVKSSFVSRITTAGYNYLSIYNKGGASDSTYVCFEPKSKVFLEEAYKRCMGTLPSDFPALACPDTNTCKTAASFETAIDCFLCLP